MRTRHKQLGFWHAVSAIAFAVFFVVTSLDMAYSLWNWIRHPSGRETDPILAARQRRRWLFQLAVVIAIPLALVAIIRLGPLRPIHEWIR